MKAEPIFSNRVHSVMYIIEKGQHGFTLTFRESIYAEELNRWLAASERALAERQGRPFGVIVDMRYLLPLGPEARAIILQGQHLFRKSGLQRSVVVLTSSAITNQFRQLAQESGVCRSERYINAGHDPDWMEHPLAWLQSQIDPDKIPARHSTR